MPLIAKLPTNRSFIEANGAYPTHLNVLSRKKNAVQRHIRRGGLGSYEVDFQSALLALCETSQVDLRFYDVGAHMGIYSALIASIFRSADPYIVAIEPTPDTAKVARSLRRANGLRYKVIETAVSDTYGEVQLYLSEISESSNSLNPEFRSGTESVCVPLTTLDRLMEDGLLPPSIVKIDVETLEANVLRGGLTTIQEHRPVVTLELLVDIDQDAIGAMLKAIEHFGYTFYQVVPEHTWEACAAEDVLTKLSVEHRDWVCAPTALTDYFFDARMIWRDSLSLCGKATNVLVAPGESIADKVPGTVGYK